MLDRQGEGQRWARRQTRRQKETDMTGRDKETRLDRQGDGKRWARRQTRRWTKRWEGTDKEAERDRHDGKRQDETDKVTGRDGQGDSTDKVTGRDGQGDGKRQTRWERERQLGYQETDKETGRETRRRTR